MFLRSGTSIIVTVRTRQDSLIITIWNTDRSLKATFADGSAWSIATVAGKIAAAAIVGTDNNDNLSGDDGANVSNGGKGNDILNGFSGNDVYKFSRGYGKDTINDFSTFSGEVDIIRLGAGITADDIVVSRSGAHIVFSIAGTEDNITVNNWNTNVRPRRSQLDTFSPPTAVSKTDHSANSDN